MRFTIGRYNRASEKAVLEYAQGEVKCMKGIVDHEASLQAGIASHSILFLCIQTQSKSKWGLLQTIMNGLKECGLEEIDHCSWHPWSAKAVMVNEIHARDTNKINVDFPGDVQERLDACH